jgi:hypothetical protein
MTSAAGVVNSAGPVEVRGAYRRPAYDTHCGHELWRRLVSQMTGAASQTRALEIPLPCASSTSDAPPGTEATQPSSCLALTAYCHLRDTAPQPNRRAATPAAPFAWNWGTDRGQSWPWTPTGALLVSQRGVLLWNLLGT